jgi:hypothetical protein
MPSFAHILYRGQELWENHESPSDKACNCGKRLSTLPDTIQIQSFLKTSPRIIPYHSPDRNQCRLHFSLRIHPIVVPLSLALEPILLSIAEVTCFILAVEPGSIVVTFTAKRRLFVLGV